jgi:hypothetical protein
MRVLYTILTIGVAFALLAGPAAAQAPGSNMPPDFYPHPPCTKPEKGHLVQPGNDVDAMRVYNARVKEFNDRAVKFNACLKTYIDNAQNDINTIQAIVHAAVADANTH